jgi:hypothetical protein
LSLPGTVSGLDLSVQAVRARTPDGQAVLIVDTFLRISGDETGEPGPLHPGGTLVSGIVSDTASNVIAEVEQERFTQQVVGGAGGEMLTTAPAGYWMHRAVHRLDPGSYEVRVAAVEPASERVGAAELETVVVKPRGLWDVSDPWLAVQHPDGSTSPVVRGEVNIGESLVAYFEVYNGASPRIGGRVKTVDPASGQGPMTEMLANEVDRAPDATPRGPAVNLTDSGGVHIGWVPLSDLPAGTYLLEFDIDDLGDGRARTVRLPLHVLDMGER